MWNNETIILGDKEMIGKILKTMRRESNITQEELSKKTFIGRSTLSDYEREKTDINFENIEKIADICNYDICFIKRDNPKHVLNSKNIDREEI